MNNVFIICILTIFVKIIATNSNSEILTRAALSDEFAVASGQYFDNDSGQFASPHPDALNPKKSQEIVRVIETILAKLLNK
jgi:hypothetical protein